MATTEYQKKLRSPKWQKKRLEILQRDEFTCQLCKDKETELHVHHEYYEKGKDPWEHPNECLKSVCKYCHLILEDFKTLDNVSGIEKIHRISRSDAYYLHFLVKVMMAEEITVIIYSYSIELDKMSYTLSIRQSVCECILDFLKTNNG